MTRADGGLLQYRRTGPTETAEIVVNRTPRLLATRALGKVTEVNPFSFTVVVEDTDKVPPERPAP